MKRVLAAFWLLLLVSSPAIADDQDKAPAQIVLQLEEEAWVETETARVVLQLKMLLTGDNATEPVADPGALFEPVAAGDWQTTLFQRGQTDTGFEQWVILAEARIPQSALTGIYDRVKQASSRGQTITVQEIDFTPSLAEREATAAGLREALYARAADEAAAIAAVFPDRGFRVSRVDFINGGGSPPVVMRAQMQEDRSGGVRGKYAGAYTPSVAERMVLQATVIVASDD